MASQASCAPAHFRQLSRRGFLSVGVLAGTGLTLPTLLARQAQAELKDYANFDGTAKSIIHIFLPGGVAQQESFDPKPYAPIEYRGEMKSIETKLPGVRFGETFKNTAQIADKLCIIRSMSHGEAAHERGTHNMFTGYRPSPALQFPSIGSVVSQQLGSRQNLPPYVCIPNVPNEFAGSGYLSSAFAPFSLGSDPAANGFKVRDLELPSGVDDSRFASRRSALEAVNEHFRKRESSDQVTAMDSFYESAYSLISSQQAREAFDLEKEPAALRDQYGRNQAGARMLLARRLVESGVRLVNLTYGSWDMHDNIVRGFTSSAPAFDQAFTALINDLEQRGRLNDTLVMVSSEFGRTPKMNNTAGRDHWPKVFSVVMAGGGVKRGVVYGSSNATASEPEEDPVTVENLFTTVYHTLGIVADKELMAPGNRPIEIVDGGTIVKELLA
ncbi:DUF1501 domain-containing protein [Planctomicrobium piriforme]|uniref:Tat (Twin-arginine translocation) pathway signal sequence n=1 Tax=Planctomicrobium piriforme TaxID=1576369 RepID=A0A1I3BGR9_9PLAN|nr:DUF1501 domain-containing protein [Planctomicrobium piriforme]SFH60931.1 Protein of unknown function [Planctomicrobium piriforme]